jgi:thiol-disulfide isomerase/thioredoxin
MTNTKEHTFEALLGPILLNKVSKYQEKPNLRNFNNRHKEDFCHGPKSNTMEALSGQDFVLFYFSGAWCPPCQSFSPKLKEFYKTCKRHDNEEKLGGIKIEIVYISSDRDQKEFNENFGKMPWLALESKHHKTLVSRKCRVKGIPALIVLDGKGNFITDTAVGDVIQSYDQVEKIAQVFAMWKAKEAVPLEEATFSQSGLACVVM